MNRVQAGSMGCVITRVNVRSTLLEAASADSWVADLLNVFWKAGSSLFKSAGSGNDTVLDLETTHPQ